MMASGTKTTSIPEEENHTLVEERLPSPEKIISSEKGNDNGKKSAAASAVDDENDIDSFGNNSNARWLYLRCSSACIQMETPLSPLELAIKTLQAIRSIDDEDTMEEQLQHKLFAVLKDGKRDLDFVFEVSEKAFELRDDAVLDGKSLRRVAAVVSGANNESGVDTPKSPAALPNDPPADEKPITNAPDQFTGIATPQILQQQTSNTTNEDRSPTKKYRSRRKKRLDHKTTVANNSTPQRGMDMKANDSPLFSTIQSAGRAADTNDETAHADFPIRKDGLDMQDDDKWSFLPSTQLPSNGERGENEGQMSARRVTRSMGLTNNDDSEGVRNSVLDSPKTKKSSAVNDGKVYAENAEESKERQSEYFHNKSAVENVEKQDDGIQMDENADDAGDKAVENTAVMNEEQEESLKADGTTDALQNKPGSVEEKLIVEDILMSDENQCEVIEIGDNPDAMEVPPSCTEESLVDDREVSTNTGKAGIAENAKECNERQNDHVVRSKPRHSEETISVENDKEYDEKHDGTIQRDENTDAMENAGSAEDRPVKNAAGGNERQHELLNVDSRTDILQDKHGGVEYEATAESTMRGNECEEIETGNKPDSMEENPPSCSEKSHIDNTEVYTTVKTRKRGECKDTVKIVFTGVTATHRHRQMVETIGAQLIDSIEDAHTATHVIASDGKTKLRRTPKLMVGICRVSRILSMEWLEHSAREQRVLEVDNFLLLGDKEAEKLYNFSMKQTIRNGIFARKRRGGVLGGWFVFVCSGVAGNKAPNMKELQLIIEAAGGNVLKSLSNEDDFDPVKTIVLTSEPSTQSQLKERGVARVERQGARLLSTQTLFHTIITQSLFFDIDDGNGADTENCRTYDGSRESSLAICNSNESPSSTLSLMSVSPVMRRTKRSHSKEGSSNIANQAAPMGHNDDISIRCSSTLGSRALHIEHDTHTPSSDLKRRKLNYDEFKRISTHKCSKSRTRDQFLSSHQSMLSSMETFSAVDDMAAAQTHGLWLDYFNEVSNASLASNSHSKSSKKSIKRPKKGVRCLRGRKRSISSMVSSTAHTDMRLTSSTKKSTRAKQSVSATTRKILLEDNPYLTWEAYVLFSLALRADKLGCHESLTSACDFFPCPIAINEYQESEHAPALSSTSKRLSLTIHAGQFHDNDRHINEAFEVFGTLQDVFSLHQQHQSGMISEGVIAMLALKAIEAVAAMHSCGVVHNDIGLDSFLVVRRVPASGKEMRRSKIKEWFLQIINFGHKSVVLNCEEQCQEAHYEHDYQCLANAIHLLLTGGIEIALNAASGSVDFTTKCFIKGNLFLRGALSWCSLIDSLLCVGELEPVRNETSSPFILQHPLDALNLAMSDDVGNTVKKSSRMHQFGWSCRVLQDLSDSSRLAEFMEGLCSHNSRFIFSEINLKRFSCYARDSRHSFSCYLSSEQTVEHLMQKESKLQEETLALAQRETQLQEKTARFERSETEHKVISKRESKMRSKEKELLQRERVHALEVQRLKIMEEDLLLRESRLEQRFQSLKRVPDHLASPLRPLPQLSHSVPSSANVKEEDHSSLGKKSSRKRKNSKQIKLPTPSSQMLNLSPSENLVSPKNTIRHKLKTNSPCHSNDTDCASQHNDFQGQSQESACSSKRKKKGSGRKTPKCSLHNLSTSPRKSPRKTPPKKVFINLDED